MHEPPLHTSPTYGTTPSALYDTLHRRLDDHPRAVELSIAALLFACSFPGSMITLPGHHLDVPWWPGVLLTGLSCAALLGRRSRPRTTVVLATLGAMAMAALGYVLTPLLLGPLMVAAHSLAARTGRRTANSFAAASITALVTTALIAGPADEPLALKLISPAAWLLLATSLGTVTRLHAAYLDAVRARAEHAERTREEEARGRAAEERLRIARDLHDVVAHHLVLANVQAGAVTRFFHDRPDKAEQVAAELAGTTAAALRELKATVGLLRRSDDDTGPPEPTPGLARLPELTASFAGAALTVTVTAEGEPRPLSAGADLTAYRIIQEALTNVTKHSPTRSAGVRLVYLRDRLAITVTNATGTPPPAAPAPGGGYGLVGMRERALSAGGSFRAGHRAGGEFEVSVELPLPAGSGTV